MASTLLFADYHPSNLEPKNSIGAKWDRLLGRLEIPALVKARRVAIKMHLGGGTGFTTVHPYFVRKLVQHVRDGGAREVFVTDSPGSVRSAAERGYTAETMGCAVVPTSGTADKYCYTRPLTPPFRTLTEVQIAGEIADAEVLIDLSHLKGHGACGFGGASKNLSMGCVTQPTRGRLHALEGGLEWDAAKCEQCNVCAENCPNHAIRFENQQFHVFYHNCKYCQHCVLICPQQALKMSGGGYADFQQGMARTTAKILEPFMPDRCLFINVLMNITIFCDCWGMTTPALVPDLGILAGRDIVAIETASLDLVQTKHLIKSSLPPGWKLGKGRHLFEKLHGKDPWVVVDALAALGCGSRDYVLQPVD